MREGLHPDHPIATSRLLLRPIDPVGDVDALHRYRSREDVCAFIPPVPLAREALAAHYADPERTRSALTAAGQALTLAIVLRETGELIGDAVLFWHSAEERSGEIGYIVGPEHAGRGYATEVAEALLSLGFDGLGLRRITGRIDARNPASAAVLRKAGMRQEAVLVEHARFKGVWGTVIDFAILDREWAARRGTASASARPALGRSLLTTPTPLEPAPRLAAAIGLAEDRLLLKRDDLIGLGGGGNKARKLAITMAEALAAGADTVVTTGAAQSNHARLTAAAAARLGLRAVLVLAGNEPEAPTGNLLLEAVLGAEVVFAGDEDEGRVAARIAEERGAHLIPFGGTSAASAEAYRAAGLELLEQRPDLGTVFVALGSGGTMAGLVAALGPDRVVGAHTGAVDDPSGVVGGLLRGMGAVGADGLRIDVDHVGGGYEAPGPEVRDALLLTARTEGVVLDPVYTARAMAALVAAARRGDLAPGPVVFVHTGGLPGLFGHPELVLG